MKSRRDVSACSRGKVVVKRIGKNVAQVCAPEPAVASSLSTPVGGQKKRWLECVAHVVLSSGVGFAVETHFQVPESHLLVRRSLRFACQTGFLASGGKRPRVKWSALRPCLVSGAVQARKEEFGSQGAGILAYQFSAQEAVDDATRMYQDLLKKIVEKTELVQELQEHLESIGLSLLLAISPVHLKIQQDSYPEAMKPGKACKTLPLNQVFDAIGACIATIIKIDWVSLAQVAHCIASSEVGECKLDDNGSVLFPDVEQAEDCVEILPLIILPLFSTFIAPGVKFNVDDLRPEHAALLKKDQICSHLVALDVAANFDMAKWCEAWCQASKGIVAKPDVKCSDETEFCTQFSSIQAMLQDQRIALFLEADSKPPVVADASLQVKEEPGDEHEHGDEEQERFLSLQAIIQDRLAKPASE